MKVKTTSKSSQSFKEAQLKSITNLSLQLGSIADRDGFDQAIRKLSAKERSTFIDVLVFKCKLKFGVPKDLSDPYAGLSINASTFIRLLPSKKILHMSKTN